MKIKYQTFVEKQLLVVRYEGDFCLNRYKQHVLEIVQTNEWNSINKILVDLRFVDIEFKMEDIAKLVDIKKNVIKKEHISVQLVDSPNTTVLTHLMQKEFVNMDLSTEYCCTIERAIELLSLSFKAEEVTKILDNLELTF